MGVDNIRIMCTRVCVCVCVCACVRMREPETDFWFAVAMSVIVCLYDACERNTQQDCSTSDNSCDSGTMVSLLFFSVTCSRHLVTRVVAFKQSNAPNIISKVKMTVFIHARINF